MQLDGLRQSYGDKAMVCPQCGRAIDVESLIESMENNPENVIFTPKKVQDLCFTWCDNCDELQLHEMQSKDDLDDDKIHNFNFEQDSEEAEAPEGDGESRPDDADESSKHNTSSSKSADGTETGEQANSGRKPFSVSN